MFFLLGDQTLGPIVTDTIVLFFNKLCGKRYKRRTLQVNITLSFRSNQLNKIFVANIRNGSKILIWNLEAGINTWWVSYLRFSDKIYNVLRVPVYDPFLKKKFTPGRIFYLEEMFNMHSNFF